MAQPEPPPPAPVPPRTITGHSGHSAPKALHSWVIATTSAVVLLVTTISIGVLWWAGTRGLNGQQLVTARLDAVKTGLAIGAGNVALFALYLAWRRQKATDIALQQKEADQEAVVRDYNLRDRIAEDTKRHQERIATATETDALERRITDLYTKAADQLGSEKAPVRLAGLYALERLAQDNTAQRQTIVNVLCAYLRMPYALSDDEFPEEGDAKARTRYELWVQERQVRDTAQQILTTHLRPGGDLDHQVDTFWPDVGLTLSGAVLFDFDLSDTRVRSCCRRLVKTDPQAFSEN